MTATTFPREVARKFRSRRQAEADREQTNEAERYEHAMTGGLPASERAAMHREMAASLPRRHIERASS